MIIKNIPKFPGYFASDDGKIYSSKRGKLLPRKLIALHKQRATYYHVSLYQSGKLKTRTVHSLILKTFRGPPPTNHESRHLNGNSLDNRLDNLVWGTRKENSDDKRLHGTMQSGERNGQAKLSRGDVITLRNIRYSYTLIELAEIFDISVSQVKRIVYRQSWK